MLFTLSKCTGHAGTRIGWTIVKDKQVARRMVKYLELSSIGVSKESQLRALLSERWDKLRQAVKCNGLFTVSEFPPAHCLFFREHTESHLGFVWMTCKDKNVD
ncbi:hypothetical protein MLD38_008427 [Melastoma candidum]|uniref:Uncharacterized protein n=1 Tax=Melastoma candidum TaxID=119954 RepID=A0ACB9RU97_9MYRT|nr:hypothetical protein MLD38_008427 [Melastoma candidum]